MLLLKELLDKKIVVKFLDGQEIIGVLKQITENYIEIDTGKSAPEIHFISALKLIRPYDIKTFDITK